MYGIFRIQKVKSTGIEAMEKHNNRAWECRNGDIDKSKTTENVELCQQPGSYSDTIQSMIDARYTGKRAVRKDAVRLVEGLITASPEFFEGKSREEILEFFKDSLNFAEEEFGFQNLVHFTIHFDEKTPHAHFGFCPLTEDGRMSAKAWFNGRTALRKLQDRFHERVGEPWGLERGESVEDTERHHKSTVEMKRNEIEELREQVKQLTQERDSARAEAAQTREEAIQLRQEAETAKNALNRLTERFETLVRNIAEVAETMKHRPLWGAWKNSLEQLRNNPIAQAVLKAGEPWQEDRDAKRAEKTMKTEVNQAQKSLADMAREAKEMSQKMERDHQAYRSPRNHER